MIHVLFYFIAATLAVYSAADTAPQSPPVAELMPVQVPVQLPDPEESITGVTEEENPEPPAEIIRKADIEFSLLLPFYFDDNFKEDTSEGEAEIDTRSVYALQFYEGALLAKDSLSKMGINLSLPVYDVAYDTLARKVLLLNYHRLKNSDLVIAGFSPFQCEEALSEAERLGIKFALTQYGNSAQIYQRPKTILMSSPPFMQCRLMSHYLANRFPQSDYFIFSRMERRENELADIFRNVLDSLLPGAKIRVADDEEFRYPEIFSRVDTLRPNHLVIPSSDESYVSSILNRIDTLNIPFHITGLPTWENFETIRLGKFRNLRVIIFSSTWLNDHSEKNKNFRKIFIEKYKTDAQFPAYHAFNFCLTAARVIAADEKLFPDILPEAFIDSDVFRFIQMDNGGFENIHIEVLQYNGFELTKAE